MSAKQSRRARAVAFSWADRYKVWDKYTAPSLSKWRAFFRKIADFIFPRRAESRKRGEEKQRGWWYRRVLKHAAHYFADRETKREAESFARAREKINRNWRKSREVKHESTV